MASEATRSDTAESLEGGGAALQHDPWRRPSAMSSVLALCEQFLAQAGFERGPWLAVAFAAGIGAWFVLPGPWQWMGTIAAGLGAALAASATFDRDGGYPFLRQAFLLLPLAIVAGMGTVWAKSALVGQPAIERPMVVWIEGKVLEREEQSAQDRVRLTVATRLPEFADAVKVRVNVPLDKDREGLAGGARVRLRARLMPPAAPMLPGGYDFARTAWFSGLAATGSAISQVEVLEAAPERWGLAKAQQALSGHVRAQLDGSSGAIAATLASGDRGAIAEDDAQAMRDSGLAHLLSISGLHVSALIAVAYLVALRLLALWPWLVLRVRLPVVAAGVGAISGVFYTLLTGAEVPTVRSCIGALLVLAALALGREALSFRMLALAAFLVLLLWPESLVGPSFQMSFSAVIAIVALSQSAWVRRWLAPRQEAWTARVARNLAMLLLTGVVIEIVLMPIALYHFHRAGAYGALANVVAIPLTTLVIMPLIALALALDLAGAGAPVWWLADQALSMLVGLAHLISAQPGAVTKMPAMGLGSFLLFAGGGLWLALWRHRLRFFGLVPATIGAAQLALLSPPDVLISGDGRHLGITDPASDRLLVLRDTKSGYARDNLTEGAGMDGETVPLAQWPDADCNRDFCVAKVHRGGREWHMLIARGRDMVPERALAAACERSDLVLADRWLPSSCRPRWLKADRAFLARNGGLTIDLEKRKIRTVAESQGDHGWRQRPQVRRRNPPVRASNQL
ncbi:MAG: ComEC/Rec2 family competence protein [Novosphingobium sp.]|nr:ComEC/Rec2 family competence protein [Novosphingobium sp.]